MCRDGEVGFTQAVVQFRAPTALKYGKSSEIHCNFTSPEMSSYFSLGGERMSVDEQQVASLSSVVGFYAEMQMEEADDDRIMSSVELLNDGNHTLPSIDLQGLWGQNLIESPVSVEEVEPIRKMPDVPFPRPAPKMFYKTRWTMLIREVYRKKLFEARERKISNNAGDTGQEMV